MGCGLVLGKETLTKLTRSHSESVSVQIPEDSYKLSYCDFSFVLMSVHRFFLLIIEVFSGGRNAMIHKLLSPKLLGSQG